MLKRNPDLPQHTEERSPVLQYLQLLPFSLVRFPGAAAASSFQSLCLHLTQVGTKPIHMSLPAPFPIFPAAQNLSSPWLRQAPPDNRQCSQSAPERSARNADEDPVRPAGYILPHSGAQSHALICAVYFPYSKERGLLQ